ncbi:MAG: ferrous iron transport protein B [Endomicrobium sp.]|jgi:ferrous iron transport protein B|nr:ferrous iron transport protein B [Endomicrobium sp.]
MRRIETIKRILKCCHQHKRHKNKIDSQKFNNCLKCTIDTIVLNNACPGIYRFVAIHCCGNLKYKLLEMGFIHGEKLRIIKNTGYNGNVIIVIKGTKIALNNKIASKILLSNDTINKNIKAVLIGNPNTGKSTIFNNLTFDKQTIANYPGVTVEKKECMRQYEGYNINFVDLPGIYSFSAYSEDEVITRNFILKEKYDVMINVINAINLERGLYLFTQLAELNVPIIIILNMYDILNSQGKIIDKNIMSKYLNVKVLSTIANKAIGINNILNSIVSIIKNKEFNNYEAARKVNFGNIINDEIFKINFLILKNEKLMKFPQNWIALKLLENDSMALELISDIYNKNDILMQIQKSKQYIEKCIGEKIEIEIVNKRYNFAKNVIKKIFKSNTMGAKKINITEIIDSFVLNKYLGILIFASVIFTIFKFSFTFSKPIIKLLGLFFKSIDKKIITLIPHGYIQSLVVNGIISGIGGVLEFFPLVLFMFFAIAFFENSGYMMRAVFVTDKIMNKFGLHGKSFLPFMLSTNGCAVPGILATRILDSKRDRLITMFVVPFMICGAKLPVFALITGAFLPDKYQAYVMFFMYILSISIALSVAKLLSSTIFKGPTTPLVMELPIYHFPGIKELLYKTWERGWLYIRKVIVITTLVSVLVWVLFTYPKAPVSKILTYNEQKIFQLEYSFAGKTAKFLEPLFKPIGMDSGKIIALMAGFAAKEVIISTFATIYAIENTENGQSLREKIAFDRNWSLLKGITFLVFCLIYTPCIASVYIFLKETGSYKLLILLVLGYTTLAWIASFIVFRIGTFLININI